jgi:hypothetical protein
MSATSRDDETLARRLRALARLEADIETPPHVEAAVMAAWDAAHAPRNRSRTRGFVRGAAAVAASASLVGALALDRLRDPGDVPALPADPVAQSEAGSLPPVNLAARSIEPGEAARQGAVRVEQATLVMVGEPLTEAEPVRVVRMRVAGSTLSALGIRSLAQPQPDSVDLEVLVGEDGVARALRVSL